MKETERTDMFVILQGLMVSISNLGSVLGSLLAGCKCTYMCRHDPINVTPVTSHYVSRVVRSV